MILINTLSQCVLIEIGDQTTDLQLLLQHQSLSYVLTASTLYCDPSRQHRAFNPRISGRFTALLARNE